MIIKNNKKNNILDELDEYKKSYKSSFNIFLKTYPIQLCVNEGDFMKVKLENNKLILEKAGT